MFTRTGGYSIRQRIGAERHQLTLAHGAEADIVFGIAREDNDDIPASLIGRHFAEVADEEGRKR